MSFLFPETLTNDSPIFQHSVLRLAFHGRFSPLAHFTVGLRPAKLQILPAVEAFSMSMCASNPAVITGPIPQIEKHHFPTGCSCAHTFSALRISISKRSDCAVSQGASAAG